MSDEEEQVQTESQAREIGWRPKEEFRGDESKWVDAKTFLERGEQVLPIVKATNERLRGDLATLHTQLTATNNALRESREAIAALEKYHTEDTERRVTAAREKLKAELIEAKKSGNVEAEVNLTEELTNLNNATAVTTTTINTETPPKKQDTTDYTKDPVFVKWVEDNPWFKDRAKAAIASQVSMELRANGDKTVGREYLDKIALGVSAELKRLGVGQSTSRVESGRGGAGGATGGGNGKGRSFSDLPDDAKAACRQFNKDLVGPNRAYKTEAEWQTKYAKDYFEAQA